MKVSQQDTELESFQERHTKVSEKLVVSEDGIQKESDGQLPELGKMVTITELKLTKESTKLESPQEKLLTMQQLKPMLLKRILLL